LWQKLSPVILSPREKIIDKKGGFVEESEVFSAYKVAMRKKALGIWKRHFEPKLHQPCDGYNFKVQVPLMELGTTTGYIDIWVLSYCLEEVAKEQGRTIYSSNSNGGVVSPKMETDLYACCGFCFVVETKEPMGRSRGGV
jgi:hypothetical protein